MPLRLEELQRHHAGEEALITSFTRQQQKPSLLLFVSCHWRALGKARQGEFHTAQPHGKLSRAAFFAGILNLVHAAPSKAPDGPDMSAIRAPKAPKNRWLHLREAANTYRQPQTETKEEP
jgi:hypothetical protein